MKNYKYKIYYPSGNTTALVTETVDDMVLRRKINCEIMNKEPEVEQVGFFDIKKKQFFMAGGEFSGNGLRSAFCDLFLKNNKNNDFIYDLGINKKIFGVRENNEIEIKIPRNDYENKIIKITKNIYRVDLDGICLLVIKKQINFQRNIKERAYKILGEQNMLNKYLASGVIYWFVDEERELFIVPVIWVKKVKTLFLETACGSGSIALSLVRTWKKRKSGIFNIFQPSGEVLRVKIEFENDRFENIFLSGKVRRIGKGRIEI